MICNDCRMAQHHICRGGTWCDCQHRQQRGEVRMGKHEKPEEPVEGHPIGNTDDSKRGRDKTVPEDGDER